MNDEKRMRNKNEKNKKDMKKKRNIDDNIYK